MGGLVNGSTVKGDLWMVETGSPSMACYPVATTSEGPGPRVGHASLLVGNAFIVFGGDTKLDEGDVLDDTLYLLNTCELLLDTISFAPLLTFTKRQSSGPELYQQVLDPLVVTGTHLIYLAQRYIFLEAR